MGRPKVTLFAVPHFSISKQDQFAFCQLFGQDRKYVHGGLSMHSMRGLGAAAVTKVRAVDKRRRRDTSKCTFFRGFFSKSQRSFLHKLAKEMMRLCIPTAEIPIANRYSVLWRLKETRPWSQCWKMSNESQRWVLSLLVSATILPTDLRSRAQAREHFSRFVFICSLTRVALSLTVLIGLV